MIDADLVIALIEGMNDARTRASDYERERSALLVRLAQLRKVEAVARKMLENEPTCSVCAGPQALPWVGGLHSLMRCPQHGVVHIVDQAATLQAALAEVGK